MLYLLLSYLNFDEPFEIHVDANKLQLGSVLSQKGKPIAFYSRKLIPAQVNYTTIECELLSIVETLKELRNILLGQQIKVYTDHKNLTYKTSKTERVMRWRLILEKYILELIYIQGSKNIAADKDYLMKQFHGTDKKYSLICRKHKIVIPKLLEKQVVECYHNALCHPGEACTELSIVQYFYWKNLRKTVHEVCSKCKACQFLKK